MLFCFVPWSQSYIQTIYSGNTAIFVFFQQPMFLIQYRIDLAGPKFILVECIVSSQIRMSGAYEVESCKIGTASAFMIICLYI